MCSDNSFSQLEFLHLYDLEKLERWDLGTSAMPLIKGLGIDDCPNLKEIPERMKDVELLKRNYTWAVNESGFSTEAWENLKRAFPDSKNGSRVIITVHKEDVAERADDRGFVHKLRFLSHEESWDPFCRKLLNVRAMTSAMERLAMDMVDKCRGLPLAIVVLSGLLSHKMGLDEWKKAFFQKIKRSMLNT
ncbi:hypothetical protein KY284_019481 [Solanum tuberosum]|nr:hypothetical protein KY284_019481 [Solanum tuberosum]